MAEHSYKAALLVGRRSYRLEPDALICRDSEGHEIWRMTWSEIQAAAFVDHKIKGLRMRRLDLIGSGKGQKQSISCTGAPGGPAADPEASAHLRLVADILDRLAAHRPGFEIGLGEYGKSRLAMFAIGVVSAGAAIVLFGLMLANGVSVGRMGEAAVPLIILFIFGALLVFRQTPWRPVPQVSAALFATALRQALDPGAG